MAFSTINKSSDYMNTVLYSGNGTTQSITGVGFQPDMVWAKARAGSVNHALVDAVRGATNQLQPNENIVEFTGGFVSFNADGFSLNNNWNENNTGVNYASWNWLANGAGSSNTDGSITSTVSANTTSGFSIVKWVGTGSNATIGHGLGVKPSMIITKPTSHTGSWYTYHKSTDATDFLKLNDTDATADNATIWNDTEPTTSVFTTGTAFDSGRTFIAYCFAEISGYSKFSSYTGNGDADGAFVYTGFRPTMVICKRTSAADPWVIMDSKREGYNVANYQLVADTNGAESSNVRADLLSNGFKARSGSGEVNDGTYIYMAFGQPIISNSGVCATAR